MSASKDLMGVVCFGIHNRIPTMPCLSKGIVRIHIHASMFTTLNERENNMPCSNAVKISMSVTGRYQLHQEALRQGRPPSEVARRFVESGLAKAVNKAPPAPEVSIDKIERSARRNKVVAAYLSGPLASAIKDLSIAESRSQSHVLRDLLRCELRRRVLLPNKQWGSQDAIEAREAVADAPHV